MNQETSQVSQASMMHALYKAGWFLSPFGQPKKLEHKFQREPVQYGRQSSASRREEKEALHSTYVRNKARESIRESRTLKKVLEAKYDIAFNQLING